MELGDLLKYIGLPKVISVSKKRTNVTFCLGFANTYLYPKGTERVVDAYFWRQKEINGASVIGHQSVLQVCRHEEFYGLFLSEIWDYKSILTNSEDKESLETKTVN